MPMVQVTHEQRRWRAETTTISMDSRCREWNLPEGSVARAVTSRLRDVLLVIVPYDQPLAWEATRVLLETWPALAGISVARLEVGRRSGARVHHRDQGGGFARQLYCYEPQHF